jgi:hypothetical protein
LLELARKSKTKDELNTKILEKWDYFREEIKRLNPDTSRVNFP